MKITRASTWAISMQLDEPYRVAYAATSEILALFLRVDAGAHTGVGCASPDPDVTGEHPAQVHAVLEAIAGLLPGLDAGRHAEILAHAAAATPAGPAALAALDMALWDLRARACSLPLWRMLGGARDRIRTFVTIGIMDRQSTVERARDALARGFRALKIKGGLDAHDDGDRLHAVRDAVGSGITLCLDANQGYDVASARAVARVAQACGVTFLEQPTPARALMALADVRRDSAVPVMADECVLTPSDALAVVRAEAADLINVKLMKVGGLGPARAIEGVALAAGVRLMVGCMDEPERAIAAGLAFALCSPAVTFADLDGHLGLRPDPTAGTLELVDGDLVAPESPGLGPLPE